MKIHCSKESKDLLAALGGYNLVERGLVPMKGKGDRQTYWLMGEDPEFKELRKERKKDSIQKAAAVQDTNGHLLVARSSLKNRNNPFKSTIPRCLSFESPKKLRFASDENLEKRKSSSHLLDVISDGSPCKKSRVEHSLDCCSDVWKTSSTSCPCIENLANSAATLAQSQLSMLDRDERRGMTTKSICHSVPMLISHHLSVPNFPIIHTLSAPTSPRKPNVMDLSKFPECEEVMPWADSTPLLKVTKPQDSETGV